MFSVIQSLLICDGFHDKCGSKLTNDLTPVASNQKCVASPLSCVFKVLVSCASAHARLTRHFLKPRVPEDGTYLQQQDRVEAYWNADILEDNNMHGGC